MIKERKAKYLQLKKNPNMSRILIRVQKCSKSNQKYQINSTNQHSQDKWNLFNKNY